jgi:hypothetical protein
MRWDDHPAHKPKPIKTANPLLFLSSSFDPVTPLRAAVKMAQKFEGAGLIEQQSLGHCTISAFSACTTLKLRAYINHGKVPPPPKLDKDQALRTGEWERCLADDKPFGRVSTDHAWPASEAAQWSFRPRAVGDEDLTVEEMREIMVGAGAVQDYMLKVRYHMDERIPGVIPSMENPDMF